MPNDSSSLTLNAPIWIGVAYVFVYYSLARSVLARINRLDPDYFDVETENGDLPTDLPGHEYGEFVRIGLYVVRGMFAGYIPLFGYVLYLATQ
jgi:hypothetical protein